MVIYYHRLSIISSVARYVPLITMEHALEKAAVTNIQVAIKIDSVNSLLE